jgi:VWFA-related protein
MLALPCAGLLAGLGAGRLNDAREHARRKKAAQPDEFTLHSDVRLVLLDVSVKDRKGGFATGLTKANFTVEENGHVQPITVFSHDDAPVTIGLLVDESRSMTPKHSDVIAAAEVFIDECNRRDEIFILNFNDTVVPALPHRRPFSDDPRELREALLKTPPAGMTALYDAVVDGLEQLESGRREKKALVLISDGGDTASKRKKQEMLDMVERSAATIYVVGLYEPDDPDRAPGLLKQVANISGGIAYFPNDSRSMIPVCRQIASEIRTRYTVGYVPMEGNGVLRRVRVKVSAPGENNFVVRTRTSYRYSEVQG